MTVIRQEDFVQSIADALQYISYYHPPDFIQAMDQAYEKEQNPAAKDYEYEGRINSETQQTHCAYRQSQRRNYYG